MRKPRKLIVTVYRNLNLKGVVYSVRGPDGKVLMHTNSVLLKNATFVVQPAGREKVRRERRKVVHAFVKGELVADPGDIAEEVSRLKWADKYLVSYNPYVNDEFVITKKREQTERIHIRENTKIKSAESILISSSFGKPKLQAQGVKA